MTGSVFLGGGEFSVSELDSTILVPIVRSGDTSGAVTVQYSIEQDSATLGDDFNASGGLITIPAGAERVFVPISILDDGDSEPTETFVVTLIDIDSGTLLAPRTARVNILDDENPVTDPVEPPLESDYWVAQEPVFENLEFPIAMEFAPQDPSLVYVALRKGTIEIHDIETGQEVGQFLDIEDQVNSAGGRGIQDIAFHPDFPATPYVYVFYNVDPPDVAGKTGNAGPDGSGNRFNYLSRFEADPATNYQTVKPGSEVILVGEGGQSLADVSGNGTVASVSNLNQPESGYDPNTGEYVKGYLKEDSSGHSGGAIAFGSDGVLYLSTGDGTSFNFADPRTVSVQSIHSLNGKVLRIDPITGDGLPDNPFVGTGDALDENHAKVWQLGLRNPFSMAFDANGNLFISDTGWYSWEEINTGGAGANFGWPFFEGGDGGAALQTPGYRDLPEADDFYDAVAAGDITITAPFRAFHHANAEPGYQFQAITAGDVVYDGDKYPEEFQNNFFFTDYNDGEVFAVNVNDRRDLKFLFETSTGSGFGPVHYTQGPDGYVYAVDIAEGTITRLLISDEGPVDGGLPIRFEAEDFDLAGYETENLAASSGNQHIRNPGTGTAEASFEFDGATGQYLFKLGYYDENDGIATLAVFVNGEEIWRFALDQQLPSPYAAAASRTSRTLETPIDLKPGDEITIVGTNERGEQSRIDYLDLIPVNQTGPGENNDPVAEDDSSATLQNVPIRISLAALFSNDDDPDGDTLALQSFGNTSLGSVQLDGTDLVFTPDTDVLGSGGFDYTVSDGRGGTATARVTVTINDGSNDDPEPLDDGAETDENVPVRIPIVDLLSNDSDPDNNPLTLVSVENASLGSAEIDGSDIVFTPAPGIFGEGGFDYTVSDGRGGTASAHVAVDIFEVPNRDPVPVDDETGTRVNTPIRIPLADIIGNDGDPDGDAVSFDSIGSTSLGTAIIDGSDIVFTPAPNQSGIGGFDYVITDGQGGSAIGHVSVAITAVPDVTRLEAEDFDSIPGTIGVAALPAASEGEVQQVKYKSQGGPDTGQPVTTSTTYDGPDGTFDLFFGGFDESDGDSRIVIRIGGTQVADFRLDQDPGGSDPDASSHVRRQVATDLSVEDGDLIEVTIYRDAGEYTRFDFLELVSSGPPTGPVGPVSDADGGPNLVDEDAATGTSVGITASAVDPDLGDSVSYSVDDGRFFVDAGGVVRVQSSAGIDAESEPSIDVTVTASSSDGSSAQESFTITVGDADEFDVGPVTDSDVLANAIAENAAAGAATGITAFADDADATDTVGYSVDDPRFTIGPDGVLKVAGGASFDAVSEPSITVEITATSSDGSTFSALFAITVANVNEGTVSPVSDADPTQNIVPEDATEGTVVGITALATDPDSEDTVSYEVDDPRFTVDAAGVIKVSDRPDFDAETEQSIDLTVTATSDDTSTSQQTFTIQVGDVDEVDVGLPVDTDPTSNGFFENAPAGTPVGITAFAEDGDITDTVSYSSPDSRFTVDANGVVRIATGAVFDALADDPIVIEVVATSTDGSTASQIFTTSVLEAPPPPADPVRLEAEDFDSIPGGIGVAAIGVASGGEVQQVKYKSQGGPDTGQPVTTSTTYSGPSGSFDLFFGGFDESDGDSRIVIEINGGEVADFLLDQDPGGPDPDASTHVRREVASGITVNDGDQIEVTIFRNNGEYTRFDFLELVPDGGVVTPANRDPVAVGDDGGQTPVNAALRIPIADILGNDFDPDGDTVSLVSIDDQVFGSAVIDGNEVVFTPDQTGTGGFGYTITDGRGGFDTGFVDIEIASAPDDGGFTPVSLDAGPGLAGAGERQWGEDVTISAFENDGSPGSVFHTADGVGVAGGRFDMQVDWDGATGSSEALVLAFANGARNISLELGRLNASEFNGQPETGRWEAYDESGDLLDSGRLDPRDGSSLGGGVFDIEIAYTGVVHELRIEATGYGNGAFPNVTGDNSDFSLLGLDAELQDLILPA